jgi:hypothetical protein
VADRGGLPAEVRPHQVLKYAVLGTLLRAGQPLSLGELGRRMRAVRPIDTVTGLVTAKRLSDHLRAQAAVGRVRRVARGWYEAVPSAMGRTSQWRYRNWESYFDEFVGRGGGFKEPLP